MDVGEHTIFPYRHRHVGKRPDLLLPDGTRADVLRRGAMFRKLKEIGVPDLNVDMTVDDLLDAYQAIITAAQEGHSHG